MNSRSDSRLLYDNKRRLKMHPRSPSLLAKMLTAVFHNTTVPRMASSRDVWGLPSRAERAINDGFSPKLTHRPIQALQGRAETR